MAKLMTLKLDAAWQPIEVISADKGFSMVYSGRAQVVENYEQGPCAHFHFPSVIVLKKYIRKRKVRMSATRKNIYWRDKYTCQYCGVSKTPLTIDHITPKGKGGGDSWENLVAACSKCNTRKGDTLLKHMDMKLLKKPRKPSKLFQLQTYVNKKQDNWKQYLFMEG